MPTPPNASVSTIDVSNIVNQSAPAPTDDEATRAAQAAEAQSEETGKPAAEQTPPKEAAAPAEAPTELSLDGEAAPAITVPSTGYEEFDTVGKMLAEKGVATAPDIMENFLETGEISLADKAVIVDALGDTVAAMAFKQLESTAEGIIAEAKADTQKSMDYANEKFNGKDAQTTWDEIQAYVRSTESGFSEADLAEMNTMLAAGGLQAQLVIDKVHSVYSADSGNSIPGALLEGDSASTGLTFEPISRADYTAAMGKAVREHGEDSPQVRDLDRRRTLSMQRGY